MTENLDYKVMSMNVSEFTYEDYKFIFNDFSTQQNFLEILGFKSRLPIGIYNKNIDNEDGNVTKALGVCQDHQQYIEKTKGYSLVHKIQNWTYISGITENNFTKQMAEHFNHYLKIDYEIRKVDDGSSIKIRRFYTMIEKLQTIQCLDFIIDENEFIDINNIKPNQEHKPYIIALYSFIQDQFEEVSANDIWDHTLFSKGLHLIE